MGAIGCDVSGDVKLELPAYGRELRRHCIGFTKAAVFPGKLTCLWLNSRSATPEFIFAGGRILQLVPLYTDNIGGKYEDKFDLDDVYFGLRLVWKRPEWTKLQEEVRWLAEFAESLKRYLENWLTD